MSELSQSKRLENVLQDQLELLSEARNNGDIGRVLAITKAVTATEKEIAKLRREEGETISRKEAQEIADLIAAVCVRVARETLPGEHLESFVETLTRELRDAVKANKE